MAGPIQTAIGQALGATAAIAAVGKKLNEDERQAAEEKPAEETEKKAKAATMAKAIKTAQDKKIDSPKQLFFWGQDTEPLATSNEMASVISSVALQNATASKQRARDKVRERKQALAKRKLAAR